MWKGWNQQWLVIPLQDDQRREEDPPLLTNETVHNWYILTLFVLTCNYHHSNDSFINMAQFRKSQPKSSSLPNPNLLQIVKLKMFSIPCVAQYISFFDTWLDFIIVCCFVTLFKLSHGGKYDLEDAELEVEQESAAMIGMMRRATD